MSAALAAEHIGLVYHVAHQMFKRHAWRIEYGDLVGAGTVGLMQAAGNFEPGRGLAFSTHAAPRIRGAILDAMRTEGGRPGTARCAAQMEALNPESPELVGDPAPEEARLDSILLTELLQALREPDRTVIRRYYLHDMTLQEIGDQLGISEARVSQIKARALRRMREIADR